MSTEVVSYQVTVLSPPPRPNLRVARGSGRVQFDRRFLKLPLFLRLLSLSIKRAR